jgi:HPt (histidine-containing phosphotransfer) domain-containing protein
MHDNKDAHMKAVPDWLEGDAKLLKGIREIFVRNAPRQMERIREAFGSGDSPTVELLSHTLKGSASMIGALSLRDAASGVEEAIKALNVEEARRYFTVMEKEFSQAISELESGG